MYATQPSADAVQLVRKDFQELWKNVVRDIRRAVRGADPSLRTDIEVVKQLARELTLLIGRIHIARTAPIEGGDRMDWRSMRFAASQTQADLLEHHRRQTQEGDAYENPFLHKTYFKETEPWRETSAWFLTTQVYAPLVRTRLEFEKRLAESVLLAWFTSDRTPDEPISFGGISDAVCWIDLLMSLSIDQSDRLTPQPERVQLPEDVVITADDYDVINARFDGVPRFNYAARLAAGSDAESDDRYVTLDQMAAKANRSKKTLERWLKDGKLPSPDVEGGGGKPHEWEWRRVREALENESGKKMPERYPSLRRN